MEDGHGKALITSLQQMNSFSTFQKRKILTLSVILMIIPQSEKSCNHISPVPATRNCPTLKSRLEQKSNCGGRWGDILSFFF